jgi:hypothetical protein
MGSHYAETYFHLSPPLMMEADSPYETLTRIHQIAQLHIPEGTVLTFLSFTIARGVYALIHSNERRVLLTRGFGTMHPGCRATPGFPIQPLAPRQTSLWVQGCRNRKTIPYRSICQNTRLPSPSPSPSPSTFLIIVAFHGLKVLPLRPETARLIEHKNTCFWLKNAVFLDVASCGYC